MALLTAPSVLFDDQLVGPGWIRTEQGRVTQVGIGLAPGPADLELPSGVLAPGLVDLQVNGALGHDLADASNNGWQEITTWLPTTGVTAFVPTAITATLTSMVDSLTRYRTLRSSIDQAGGARTLGFHLEGPFLAPDRRGAHALAHLTDPKPAAVETLLAAGGDDLAYLTLAPERNGAVAAIERLTAAGVRVAVGHSDATDAQVTAAVDAGATMITHLYNAQRPLHHRDPGVVGAALADSRLTLGLIVDGHHVADTAVRTAFAAAGERIALVTDATSAIGLQPGTYELGGARTHVRAGQPPVRESGALAGTVLRLDQAVAAAIALGIDPATVLTAATRIPADALARTDLGRLRPGAHADLTWFDDDWQVRATWVAGEQVHP